MEFSDSKRSKAMILSRGDANSNPSEEDEYITLCDLDGPSSPRSNNVVSSKHKIDLYQPSAKKFILDADT